MGSLSSVSTGNAGEGSQKERKEELVTLAIGPGIWTHKDVWL